MTDLTLPDMSCEHCVRAITAAVRSLDAAATLDFDLARQHVHIDSTATNEAIRAVLEAEGYPAA